MELRAGMDKVAKRINTWLCWGTNPDRPVLTRNYYTE